MLHSLLAATLATAGLVGGTEPSASLHLPSARDVGFVSLESLAGKVVYVDVTRTTCARCDAQAMRVVELRGKYKDRGFEVVTVYDELPGNGDDPFARVTADAAKKHFEHPVALNDGGEFHNDFYVKIQGTPSGFLVTRTGAIEPLGMDPLSDTSWAKTTGRIEEALSDPGSASPGSGASREPLAPFTLLPYTGGPIRSSELTGQPTLLVAWAPGPLMTRLGPAIEHVQQAYGDRLRVIAVTFGDFTVAAEEAKKVCPSVMLAAPDTHVLSSFGGTRLPQMVFVDANGAVEKRIATIYGANGIEAAMLDRIAHAMVGAAKPEASPTATPTLPSRAPSAKPAPTAKVVSTPTNKPPAPPVVESKPAAEEETPESEEMPASEPSRSDLESRPVQPASRPASESSDSKPAPPKPKEASVFRDEKFGYTLPIPEGFAPAIGDPEDRIQLVGSGSAMRVTARFIEGGSSAQDIDRYRTTVVSSRPGYKVKSEEKLEDGTLLVNDQWNGADGVGLCATRIFVPTPKGVLEVFTSGPLGDYGKHETEYRSAVRSVRVDR